MRYTAACLLPYRYQLQRETEAVAHPASGLGEVGPCDAWDGAESSEKCRDKENASEASAIVSPLCSQMGKLAQVGEATYQRASI